MRLGHWMEYATRDPLYCKLYVYMHQQFIARRVVCRALYGLPVSKGRKQMGMKQWRVEVSVEVVQEPNFASQGRDCR